MFFFIKTSMFGKSVGCRYKYNEKKQAKLPGKGLKNQVLTPIKPLTFQPWKYF